MHQKRLRGNIAQRTKQTIHDHQIITRWKNKNGDFFDYVKAYLKKHYGKNFYRNYLLVEAISLKSRLKGLSNIGRLSKRTLDPLILWFCDNWDIILPEYIFKTH